MRGVTVYCPYCKTANAADAVHCLRCGRPMVGAVAAVKRRLVPPLREPMEERLLWALALGLVAFLAIAALVNIPSPAGRVLGGLLLPLAPAGIIYRMQRCDMFARRRVRVAGGSARPGMLLLWGWVFWILLVLPHWSPGTPPDAVFALIGACAVGLLVLDEWRGLALLAASAAAFAGAGVVLGQLAPAFFSSSSSLAMLALVLWFAAVWVSERGRKPD